MCEQALKAYCPNIYSVVSGNAVSTIELISKYLKQMVRFFCIVFVWFFCICFVLIGLILLYYLLLMLLAQMGVNVQDSCYPIRFTVAAASNCTATIFNIH